MEATIFGKYVNIVRDIEDEHFKCDSVCSKMLHRFKSGKKDLTVRNLLRKWKSETANFQSFWYKSKKSQPKAVISLENTQIRRYT